MKKNIATPQVALSHILSSALVTIAFSLPSVAHAICATTPTVSVGGTYTDLAGFCSAIATAETALSSAETAASTSSTAAATNTTATKTNLLYLQQVEAYAQDVLAYQQQVIQVERFIRDLEENPLEAVVPNVNQLVKNQQEIAQLAKDIEKNSSSVGDNLVKNLEHADSIGLGQGSKFALWSEARRKNAEESYAIVRKMIKKAEKQNEDITKAIKNAAAAEGQTASQKAFANAAALQLTLLQDIGNTLNQLLGAQAVENGARLANEIAAAKARARMAEVAPGSDIDMPEDSYKGPGKVNNKGF